MERPVNLRTLFAAAKLQSETLESAGQPSSKSYQENLQVSLGTFQACRVLADHLALFSPNETIDDISSADIQYLTIDYHIAELLLKSTDPARKALLRQAQSAYERYLRLLDTYVLLSQPDHKLYERYLDSRDTFSLLSKTDASRRRETKIARFKQEKELKQQLDYLSATSSPTDETQFRALHLATLPLYTHRSFYALDLIAQELAILSLAPPIPPPDPTSDIRDPARTNKDNYSTRLDPSASTLLRTGAARPILNPQGRPLQPFTLLDNRQRLRDGVFRADHSLPTMTIDEYLAEERRRGGMVDGGGEQGVVGEVDEDDIEKVDRETDKAREWDEFKESNPKGSGNTLNRG